MECFPRLPLVVDHLVEGHRIDVGGGEGHQEDKGEELHLE